VGVASDGAQARKRVTIVIAMLTVVLVFYLVCVILVFLTFIAYFLLVSVEQDGRPARELRDSKHEAAPALWNVPSPHRRQ